MRMTRPELVQGSVEDLYRAIRNHDDALSDLYERLWGEHIHHGYWSIDDLGQDHHVAQVRLVEELAGFARVARGCRLLDVGCGLGGSSIWLAKQLGCRCEGIGLTPTQVERARGKVRAAGLEGSVQFRTGDAMELPYEAARFDVVWALESCEALPDKRRFFAEALRVLRPGGTLAVAAWCRREGATSAADDDRLKKIYRGFTMAYVLPASEYVGLCEEVGFRDIRVADWSGNTGQTWNVGAQMVKPFLQNPNSIWHMVKRSGADILRLMRSVPLLKDAYKSGLVKYGVIAAHRPT